MKSVDQVRKLLLAVALLALVAGVVLFAAHNERYLDEIPSADFAINRVAAQQMLDGLPLYDRAASRARIESEAPTFDVVERDTAQTAYIDTYSSFIGPPSTALVYTPWAELGYKTARSGYRIDEFSGDRYGFGRLMYYNRAVRLPDILGSCVFAGASLEAGKMQARSAGQGSAGTVFSGSLFLAASTFAGPAYFGFGLGENGNYSVYLLLGKPAA